MAGFKSNYLRAKVLDHLLGSTTFTAPSTIWAALHTAALAVTNTGDTNEVTGTNYARIPIVNNNGTTSWNNAVTTSTTGALKTNVSAIDFGTAGTTSWGVISWASLVDGASGASNVLYAGPLTTPKTIASDDGFSIPAGGFSISEA